MLYAEPPKQCEPFDQVFDLYPGQAIRINNLTKIHYSGTTSSFGTAAKFLIDAPQDVCIMRLELFANNIQAYQTVLQVDFGDKVSIEDKHMQMSFIPAGRGRVKVGIASEEELTIKKSFFNDIER